LDETLTKETGIVFVGVPHAGKSTYLALLYLAIANGQSASTGLGSHLDDREFVNRMAGRLYRCEQMPRTETGRLDSLRLSIVLSNGDQDSLFVPDLSGEIWSDVLAERSWSPEMHTLVANAAGVCIFANVSDFHEDPTIADSQLAASALGQSYVSEQGGRIVASQRRSTQVELVDLIQVVTSEMQGVRKRVSVILSAFDTVEDETPAEWISMNAPMLEQYLRVNATWLDSRVFGVSAQGGSFENASDVVDLQELDPLARGWVKDSNGAVIDVDVPTLWAMRNG